MKKVIALSIIFLVTANILAATNYVSKTGNHISPFDSWANAATNIQTAINIALSGDMVLVNDGTYYPGNQISITKDIIVKSVNSAEKTIVNGGFPVQTNRCFDMKINAVIDGFTITNGCYNDGGGVAIKRGCIVRNCNIIGNTAFNTGGGVYFYPDGGALPIIQNCIIKENTADVDGGGIHCALGSIIENCAIVENTSLRVFYNMSGQALNDSFNALKKYVKINDRRANNYFKKACAINI